MLNNKYLSIIIGPPIDVSDTFIEQKKIYLKNDSLPNSMFFISFNNMDILSKRKCRGNDNLNITSVNNLTNVFNEKYKEKYNHFIEIERSDNSTFEEI